MEAGSDVLQSSLNEIPITTVPPTEPLVPGADFLSSSYSKEELELIAKKDAADAERQDQLRKRAADEQDKKAALQKKGAKEFADWLEYEKISTC